MSSLYLSDILKRAGLPIERTKLLRHVLSHPYFKDSYQMGYLEQYQQLQKPEFFRNVDYILGFVSESGTTAKFLGCYKVIESSGETATVQHLPADFPAMAMVDGVIQWYQLEKTHLMEDLEQRMLINWGNGARSWAQWAKNEKAILAIQYQPRFVFKGYENLILSYQELTEIVKDKTLYESWHIALSSIYAIYLITDRSNGKHYVGSAYGEGGLLGRWTAYVDTRHGGNKGIIEAIKANPDQYHNFQYSVLQIIPKSSTIDDVIAMENLHKAKLLSKEFGMNEN